MPSPIGSIDCVEERSVTDGSDLEWLGLHRLGAGRRSCVLEPALARFDEKFYGGTGIAVATAVMEVETGRRALWANAQFVSSAATGEPRSGPLELLGALRVFGAVLGLFFARIGDRARDGLRREIGR